MNKTITINLSGIVFHIDENAFEKLKAYLEKLKSHFGSAQGSEEIIHDIESRIAEMFSERISDAKNVITIDEVESVIAQMGNPEEVAGEESKTFTDSSSATERKTYADKRFYRNVDDRMLGGVCSGIAAYFDIDPVWLRLAFALSFFFAGTGLLLYIILWVIVPAARTTAEKIQMRGERVNIPNIEKNIREEMGNVKERMEKFGKQVGSEETRQRVKNAGSQAVNFAGEVFRKVFLFIGKILGFFLMLFSIVSLVMLTLFIFSFTGIVSVMIPSVLSKMIFAPIDIGWFVTGIILLLAIPLVLLLLNGIKILFNVNLYLKRVGFIMLFFWLAGVGITAYQGVKLAKEFQKEGTIRSSFTLSYPADTLKLSLNPTRDEWNEMRNEFDNDFSDDMFITNNEDSVFVRTVSLDIQSSNTDTAELVFIRHSRGNSSGEAKKLANEIEYHYSLNGNTLTLSPVCMLSTDTKFRGQNIDIILKLPVGKSVFITKDLRMILDNVQTTTDTNSWDMVGYTWLMTKDGLECKDFIGKPDDPNESHEIKFHFHRIHHTKSI